MSIASLGHEYFLHPVAWLALAAVMGIVEVVLSGYLFLGFALGAVLVSAMLFLGLEGWFLGVDGFAYLLVFYAAVSLLSWYVLRRVLKAQADVRRVHRDINEDPYKGAKD